MTYKDYAEELTKRVIKLYGSYQKTEERINNWYVQAVNDERYEVAAEYAGQLNVIRDVIKQLELALDFNK